MSYNILPDGITINTESKESKTENKINRQNTLIEPVASAINSDINSDVENNLAEDLTDDLTDNLTEDESDDLQYADQIIEFKYVESKQNSHRDGHPQLMRSYGYYDLNSSIINNTNTANSTNNVNNRRQPTALNNSSSSSSSSSSNILNNLSSVNLPNANNNQPTNQPTQSTQLTQTNQPINQPYTSEQNMDDYEVNGIPCPMNGETEEATPVLLQCSICRVNQIQTVNFPCMHACFCLGCVRPAVRNSDICPICRTPYMNVSVLYINYQNCESTKKRKLI